MIAIRTAFLYILFISPAITKIRLDKHERFYPVILSSLIARPSDEDYKTLIGISIAKVHLFLRLKLYDFTQLQNINHKKL